MTSVPATGEDVPGRRAVRAQVAAGAVLAAFAALLARLVWLQCVEHEKWADMARRAHFVVQTLPADRGMLLDREGREVAVTFRVESVGANPRAVRDREATAGTLARLLRLDRARVRELLSRENFFVWIKRHASPEEADAVRRADLHGIELRPENRRFYPLGNVLGHVTGFVDVDGVGLAGIEHRFDRALAGRPGRELVRRDGRQRLIASTARVDPVPGRSVVLALDSRIQTICREEVTAAVEEWKGRWGIGIVMDPHTGDVLAMVSLPDYDPNQYRRTPAERMRNHATADWFEPGSTLKPFSAAALLQTGLADLETQIFCHNGFYAFGGHRVRDVHGYGWLSLKSVVVKSSNIGIIKAAQRLGPQGLHAWLERFGFGRPTGLEVPDEAQGLLRPVERWTSYSMSSIPMGQEVACTGIQLARAFCVFANGGWLVQPRLVLGLASNDGATMIERFPVRRERILDEGIARLMREDILVDVVNVGTARRARLEGVQIAGKTGTAQIARADGRGYEPGAYMALFVGIAPADEPRVVVLVAVNRPQGSHYGGTVAAPAVARIIERSLVFRAVLPTDGAERFAGATSPAGGVAMLGGQATDLSAPSARPVRR